MAAVGRRQECGFERADGKSEHGANDLARAPPANSRLLWTILVFRRLAASLRWDYGLLSVGRAQDSRAAIRLTLGARPSASAIVVTAKRGAGCVGLVGLLTSSDEALTRGSTKSRRGCRRSAAIAGASSDRRVVACSRRRFARCASFPLRSCAGIAGTARRAWDWAWIEKPAFDDLPRGGRRPFRAARPQDASRKP